MRRGEMLGTRHVCFLHLFYIMLNLYQLTVTTVPASIMPNDEVGATSIPSPMTTSDVPGPASSRKLGQAEPVWAGPGQAMVTAQQGLWLGSEVLNAKAGGSGPGFGHVIKLPKTEVCDMMRVALACLPSTQHRQ